MRLSWDEAKRQITLEQRGLDFAWAAEVFAGRHITIDVDRNGEMRCMTIGYLELRMIVVVWIKRDGTRRVISMRRANVREQQIYQARLD